LEEQSVTGSRHRPYEWVVAVGRSAVDPAEHGARRIADLELAPRDADGRVRFEFDVRLLRPRAGGNGRALLVVPNRGMTGGVPFSAGAAPAFGPGEDPDPGDAFLLERGWTIAWCGWQWDVRRDQGGLGLAAPLADVEPGPMRLEFRPDAVQADHPLSDSSPLFAFEDYPTADQGDPEATLWVRTTPMGSPRLVPRERWRFVDRTHVALDGGFQPFHWYQLVYRPSIAPVVGTGLLAVRDVGSWLHGSVDHVLAYGASQSGRFLRHLLYEGLNVDEAGHRVFDGLFTHIAGARRGEFNCRYGQPSLTHPLTPDYGPPYATGDLLERQAALGPGGGPKVVATNSAWEYWRGDGALVHQDPETGADLAEHPDSRTYLLAGTDHFGPFPVKDQLPVANPVHHLDPGPVLRALLMALEAWACDGVEPPASRVPRQADGTAVTRQVVLETFTDGARPDPDELPFTPRLDPEDRSWPLSWGEPTVALVSAVDGGGNEVAGVRLPAQAVATSAYTGWNPRRPVAGLPSVLYEFAGSRLRLQAGTPPTGAELARRTHQVALALVAQGLLLAEDVERTVAEALDLRPPAADR